MDIYLLRLKRRRVLRNLLMNIKIPPFIIKIMNKVIKPFHAGGNNIYVKK